MNVGDKVKIGAWGSSFNGMEGTITEERDGMFPYLVGDIAYFAETELELLEPERGWNDAALERPTTAPLNIEIDNLRAVLYDYIAYQEEVRAIQEANIILLEDEVEALKQVVLRLCHG